MKKTLKSMSAAECSSERSRHRHDLGFLALKRMRSDTTADERAVIDAKVLKIRRRMVRLDRRRKAAEKFEACHASGWQPIPDVDAPELAEFKL